MSGSIKLANMVDIAVHLASGAMADHDDGTEISFLSDTDGFNFLGDWFIESRMLLALVCDYIFSSQ